MDFYDKITAYKKVKKLNNNTLGEVILMNGDTFRKALSRKSLSEMEIKALERFMDEITNDDNTLMHNQNFPVIGYYYPDVFASAGLETEMQNAELNKIPINIPNWEKGIDFINVYGDSMYPKFCSGEIIGIKEVEARYVNYGYAYVVVFNDGQVFLKYIRKGKDDEHWLLASENDKYESKEYHLSLIKKVFIIKGVISKTTM